MDVWELIKCPSYSQAVKRIVKLAIEAYGETVGPYNRDGFIRATLTPETDDKI